MFKKIHSSEHGKSATRYGDNYVKIYDQRKGAKGKTAMAVILSDEISRRSNLTIGERASIHMVEDEHKKKWLLIERDQNGSMVCGLSTKSKTAEEIRTGLTRVKIQVRALDWMLRHIAEKGANAREFRNNSARVTEGAVAFPLEADRDKAWFQRG